MVQMSKASIRKQYKKIREALPAKQVKKLSVLINKNLSQQEEYKQAKKAKQYKKSIDALNQLIELQKKFQKKREELIGNKVQKKF